MTPLLHTTPGANGMTILNRHIPNSAGGINIEHVATVKTVGETFLASDGWRTVEHRVVRS